LEVERQFFEALTAPFGNMNTVTKGQGALTAAAAPAPRLIARCARWDVVHESAKPGQFATTSASRRRGLAAAERAQ